MGGVSNHLLGFLNFFTALLSIPILGVGIWLATKHSTDCMRFLQWPVIIMGLFLLLLSVAGLVAACCHVNWLLWVYTVVMMLLIVLLFCFTVFTFVVTNKVGAGDAVSGKRFKEFHLGNYSSWLQNQVNKASNWAKIKSCLADSKTCSLLADDYTTIAAFSKANLSPIQSGCCKPPTACNFTFITPTNWTNPTNGGANTDCQAWSDDASQLCYGCNSCKAGVLQNMKHDWYEVAIVNVIMLVFLLLIFSVACCALQNVRRDKYYIYA